MNRESITELAIYIDAFIGKKGTPERRKFDSSVKSAIWKYRIEKSRRLRRKK
jgi:hypothetical protein